MAISLRQLEYFVTVVDEGNIRRVRMNRLDKKNAITDEMYDKLAVALEGAAHSKAITAW